MGSSQVSERTQVGNSRNSGSRRKTAEENTQRLWCAGVRQEVPCIEVQKRQLVPLERPVLRQEGPREPGRP